MISSFVYESICLRLIYMHFMQVLDTHGRLLTALGYGLWPCMVLLCEVVQTFILADFCYYYVKRSVLGLSVIQLLYMINTMPCFFSKLVNIICSLVGGQLVLRLPSGVV